MWRVLVCLLLNGKLHKPLTTHNKGEMSIRYMAIGFRVMGRKVQWFPPATMDFLDLAVLLEHMLKSIIFTVLFEGNMDPVLQG
jgi:hypothetical protein